MSSLKVEGTTEHEVFLLFTPQAVNFEVVTALINKVKELIDNGVRSATLLLSSPGGNVYAGLLAYNFLKGCPIKLTTHNIGICDSITTVIYAAGSTRLSVPHGRFLMHGITANFAAGSGLSEIQLEERLKTLRNDADNIAGVIATATGRQESDIHQDIRNSLTLNPEQAVQYGLVQEIRENLYPANARVERVA